MYKAIVNTAAPVNVAISPAGITLNEQSYAWDLAKLAHNQYHILKDDRSFSLEVLSVEAETKTVRLKINGHIHMVQVKDRFDLLLEKMGMSNATVGKVNNLKAPMPGLILGISIQPGDVVAKGDTILILEAMKMENVIKAPGDGTVKSVKIQKGDRVEKGQVLVEF